MTEPELYVPAREQHSVRRGIGLGLARLWFVCGALFVGFFLIGALLHLGEPQARDWFDTALFGGWAWFFAFIVLRWIARGFAR